MTTCYFREFRKILTSIFLKILIQNLRIYFLVLITECFVRNFTLIVIAASVKLSRKSNPFDGDGYTTLPQTSCIIRSSRYRVFLTLRTGNREYSCRYDYRNDCRSWIYTVACSTLTTIPNK